MVDLFQSKSPWPYYNKLKIIQCALSGNDTLSKFIAGNCFELEKVLGMLELVG